MKITKRQLRRIIKEEAADCAKDYRLGTMSRQEYEDCLKRFEEPSDYGYRKYPPRKTSYVGASANQDKIAAVQAAIEAKPNNFLQSVLSQLQRGRGLSRKQNAIVKKILIKSDPEAARLFEGSKIRITKRQLRKIIKEEKLKLVTENRVREIVRKALLEDRAGRLTLNLKLSPSGDDLELEVGESGSVYNLGRYVSSGIASLMKDFEADHGMPIPTGTIVYDVDGVDVGDLPVEKMFQTVADMYSEF